jgi:hypothetical protein
MHRRLREFPRLVLDRLHAETHQPTTPNQRFPPHQKEGYWVLLEIARNLSPYGKNR